MNLASIPLGIALLSPLAAFGQPFYCDSGPFGAELGNCSGVPGPSDGPPFDNGCPNCNQIYDGDGWGCGELIEIETASAMRGTLTGDLQVVHAYFRPSAIAVRSALTTTRWFENICCRRDGDVAPMNLAGINDGSYSPPLGEPAEVDLVESAGYGASVTLDPYVVGCHGFICSPAKACIFYANPLRSCGETKMSFSRSQFTTVCRELGRVQSKTRGLGIAAGKWSRGISYQFSGSGTITWDLAFAVKISTTDFGGS